MRKTDDRTEESSPPPRSRNRAAAGAVGASQNGSAPLPVRAVPRFTPPQYNCRTLRRTRLEEAIQTSIKERAATLVTAPAGYGKSLLVATCCRAIEDSGAHVVWIHLDARDNSYDRLVRLLDVAFSPRLGGSDCRQKRLTASASTYLVEWLEDLATDECPQVLVLDDYEVAEDPRIHALVDDLIGRCIPNAHVIVVSRTVPPLALSRLRHRQQLNELTRTDLAFTKQEIESLLQGQFNLKLKEQSITLVHETTEGWPVAVQLLGTALSQRPDADAFISTLSGCDTDIADFLSAEVLSRQPPEIIDFLIRMSPLTRVSADICKAVTGSADAGRLLERIVKANLPLFPLDRTGTWYRFHPLFRSFLSAELDRRADLPRDVLLRAASAWCEQNDFPAEAIDYAIELRDSSTASRLIMQFAERFVYTSGDHSRFLAWMGRLKSYPPEYDFDLKYWYAWSLVISHRTFDATKVLADLERLAQSDAGDSLAVKRRARAEIIRILILVFTDQLSDCMNTATEWLSQHPDQEPFDIASMATSLAAASCATGEFAIGRSALQTARYASESSHSPYAAAWGGVLEGTIAMSLGDFPVARTALTHHYEAARIALGTSSSALSTISLLLSATCYELGDLEASSHYLSFGLPHIQDHGLIESAIAGFRVLIRSKDRSEGFEEALNACYQCELNARTYAPRLSVLLLHEYVCLMLRHGKIDKATEATGFDGTVFQNPSINVPNGAAELYELAAALIKARVLVAVGHAEAALKLIAPALAIAAGTNRRPYKIEFLIVRSRAEAAAGRQQRAHRTLLEALTEANQLGMVQIFLDEGSALHPLLESVMPMFAQLPEANTAFLDALGAAFAARVTKSSSESSVVIPDLSKREVTLLRLVDSGLSNEAIAKQLFLSPRTVKWYLYNVFPKLGAKNRTAAAAKARTLGYF